MFSAADDSQVRHIAAAAAHHHQQHQQQVNSSAAARAPAPAPAAAAAGSPGNSDGLPTRIFQLNSNNFRLKI